jgi:hypothetical protein
MEDQPWTARGIVLCLLTLVQHTPGSQEVPRFEVRIEDRQLVDGLKKDARVIATGELGRREGWNTPVLIDHVEAVPVGVPMDLANEVDVVGKRVSAEAKPLQTLTLYDLTLEVVDGSTLKVKVFKDLFEKLEETEDGQMLRIKGALKTFVGRGQDRTFVRATDLEVIS